MSAATQLGDLPVGAIDLPARHRPRKIRFLGYEVCDDWSVKLYGIASEGEAPRPALVDAMREQVRERLPRPATGEGRHGVAFAIAHDAADFGFVLVDWWYGRNEVHQVVLSTALSRPRDLAPHPLPAIGCVWELGVIDFERRAWLRHVLDAPEGRPSLAAYMAERYHDEV